jgi:hypothetical protein
MLQDDAVTSAKIADNTIVNANINSSAAIAYSKLNLATSITTSDLATGITTTHGLGSASTPSITFTGDTNTGIFSPTADTIAFTEGGTEAMRIDSSGNVGIGTSPSSRLHTLTSSGANILTVEASAISQSAVVSLVTNASTPGQAILYMGRSGAITDGQVGYDPNNNFLYFYTNNVERMRINSSGNVQFAGNIGLGGTTPTTSGTGISFPATQSASSDANTLDDYEEGTFSPIIVTGFTGTAVYHPTANVGRYTKIGNRVYVNASVEISSGITGSAGLLQYGGLPFTSSSTTSSGFYFYYNRNWASGGTGSFYMTMNPSNTTFYITATNGQAVSGNNASFSLLGNAFQFQGFYEV